MSAKSQPEDRWPRGDDSDPLSGLDHIEDSLRDRIDQDRRFQSGVPEHQRPTDLDFILMSGLTRPAPDNLLEDDGVSAPPGDIQRPLSAFDPDDHGDSGPVPPQHARPMDSNIIRMRETANETEPAGVPDGPAAFEEPEAAQPEPEASRDKPFADEFANYAPRAEEHGPHAATGPEDSAQSEPGEQEPEPQPAEMERARAAETAAEPEPLPELTAHPASEEAVADERIAHTPDLAEAELFLQALESQPREPALVPPEAAAAVDEAVDAETAVADPAEWLEPGEIGEAADAFDPIEADAVEPAEDFADEPELPVRESYSRHSPRRRSRGRGRRRIVRLATAGIALLAAAASVAALVAWLQPVLSTPERRLASAHELAADEAYAQASDAFADFAGANPQHVSRAEAQFLAAHFASITPGGDFDEEQALAAKALALFEAFLDDNPTHAKAARAWTIVAQLHHKLGQHEKAINILRDPVLRLRDPESALPGLRTLARSYVRLGEYEAAVSAYQQAAALSGNYAPDADYDELGDLFKLRADRAENMQEASTFRQAAIENWKYAVRVPGIDPSNKAKIQDKIKWLESQPGEPQTAPAAEAATAVATAPGAAPEPAPADEAKPDAPQAAAMDPAAEARFLGGVQ